MTIKDIPDLDATDGAHPAWWRGYDYGAQNAEKPKLTEHQLREMLARECRTAGGQNIWADLHNISAQHICDVLKGRRSIGPSVARALGLQRIVFFEAIGDWNGHPTRQGSMPNFDGENCKDHKGR